MKKLVNERKKCVHLKYIQKTFINFNIKTQDNLLIITVQLVHETKDQQHPEGSKNPL